jgi:3-oxoacyl-[acyl-carrier-protein] synthase II
MGERRVAITGIGLLCALGADRESSWKRLVAGECGIRDITLFDTTGFRGRRAAEISDYGADRRFTPWERRRLSRSDQVAVIAATEALDDSGLLDSSTIRRDRVAVMLGSGTSDLLRNEEYLGEVLALGLARAKPSKIFNHFSSTSVDVLASRFGFGGARACVAAACSSSTIAIGHAADEIRFGRADAAVCGAADVLSRLTFSGFNALRLMDPEPCRPFDASRAGMNIGEAGAVLVLEEFERASRRAAPIYAELVGYGLACEAYHPTSPEPDGKAVAATFAATLKAARVDASEIEHVNAHGTGTIHNDRAEARGMRLVFGERAGHVPVNAIKSMVGHCLGAAGAVEAAIVAMTIARRVIPPTINHRLTDPECALDIVANSARDVPVRCAMSMSLAFGGNDAAVVMRAV